MLQDLSDTLGDRMKWIAVYFGARSDKEESTTVLPVPLFTLARSLFASSSSYQVHVTIKNVT